MQTSVYSFIYLRKKLKKNSSKNVIINSLKHITDYVRTTKSNFNNYA